MHNNIMAAGSRDHPPMLATGRYAQWQSCFMRYVDTKPNGDALRKCILQGPCTLSTIIIPGQPATDDSPAVEEQTVLETLSNISPKNKAHYDADKEAIHLILTRTGDDIYVTVDPCKTAHEMCIAIERLQQCESLNKQDVKTSLFWEFGRFTSRDGESIESYYSRFYKIMNEMQTVNLDKESYHKLFDILKQYQKEVNEIHAEKIARNANPLALVAATQQYPDTYYQTPKPHKSFAPPSKQSSSTRSHATTRYKGKEIAKPITPPFESASEEDIDPKQAQRDKDMQKNLARIAKYFKKIYNNLRTSSNTRNKNVDTSPRHFAKECRKPKREKHYTYHKEKMLLCKQAEKCVSLQAEQADWLEDTDEVVHSDDDYNVFANVGQHFEQPVSINNTCLVEKVDSNVIPDSSDMCDNDNQADKNAKECDDERVNKEIELEKYKTYHDRTTKHDTLERKLKETLGLLAQKEHDIKEGLKIKAYEIFVIKEKNNELVKQSLLTKSRYEGLLKEKNTVLTTVLQPHSSRVGFITTCSYLSFKDIYLASRFKNHEISSIKDKDFRNSDIKDHQSQTKKCSPGRLLALKAFSGRLLALMKKRSLQAFKDDAKYEHVGQDTRSQDGKDNKDK
ncbi:hypothetical protein Tco_0478121 [Tanacetum coccineum]